MKKTILFICTLLFSAGYSNAQLEESNFLYDYMPQHVKDKLNEFEFKQFSYLFTKSNISYDAPQSIDKYDVDIFNNETLDKVYEFTYSPSGVLTTRVRKDAALTNEQKITYNFNAQGQVTSTIYEIWNGANWIFDYRQILEYTSTGLLSKVYSEVYNNPYWDYDYGSKFEYSGGEATPYMVLVSSSNDDVTWNDYIIVSYSYSGSTPSEVEFIYYDPNYLTWYPSEKWQISNWGLKPFKADFIFNPAPAQLAVTDNLIYKQNTYDLYPADFTYFANFNTSTWMYDNQAMISSNFNGNNDRTELFVNEYNGSTYDSSNYMSFYYDPCYGYKGRVSKDYVSPNTWTITGGEDFLGYTSPYGSSCFVYAYNYFSNFSDTDPSGIRTKRWVINQANDLGIEEENDTQLSVYPNPAVDNITVEFNGEMANVDVLTTNGTIIKSIENFTSGESIDLSDVKSGMYLLRMNAGKGLTTQLIVIE